MFTHTTHSNKYLDIKALTLNLEASNCQDMGTTFTLSVCRCRSYFLLSDSKLYIFTSGDNLPWQLMCYDLGNVLAQLASCVGTLICGLSHPK